MLHLFFSGRNPAGGWVQQGFRHLKHPAGQLLGKVQVIGHAARRIADHPQHLAHRAGFDPAAEPFLIRPTLHYQNGGVAIDAAGRTGVPGLLAAGEVTGGLHGRNRMMGNALLELCVFGRRAGAASAADSRTERPRNVGLTHLADWRRALIAQGLPLERKAPVLFPPYGNYDATTARRRAA